MVVYFDGCYRNFAISTGNVETGEFETFTQDDVTIYEVPDIALASSSIPGWFQPRPFRGNLYMDGGTIYNTDATDAIKGCLNAGYAEEDIVLDIIACNTSSVQSTEEQTSTNAFKNW